LRINLNVQGCGMVATPRSLSHSPSAPPPSFTQSTYPPRSLVRDGQTSPHRPRLVVSRSTCPPLSSPPPREQLCTRSCSNKTHTLQGLPSGSLPSRHFPSSPTGLEYICGDARPQRLAVISWELGVWGSVSGLAGRDEAFWELAECVPGFPVLH
jgi:hypothetical protein